MQIFGRRYFDTLPRAFSHGKLIWVSVSGIRYLKLELKWMCSYIRWPIFFIERLSDQYHEILATLSDTTTSPDNPKYTCLH